MLLRQNIHDLLEEKLQTLNRLRPLSKTMVQKLRERFEVEMTYNSNAIEGNSLTLKETYWVIQEGLTIKGRPVKDILETKSHKAALDFLYELIEHDNKSTFSEHTIKQLHQLIIKDIDPGMAGRYRNIDVFIGGSDHTPPSALDVPLRMRELMKWQSKNQKLHYVVEFAAMVHHMFVNIHPFEDGNGRTGRLVMNIFLMHYGFPLVIIQKNDRSKYYRVLQAADKGNYKPLVNFIGQAVLRSMNIYLDALLPSKEKEPFVTLAEAAKHTSYSQAYLGKLAKEGKIDAVKLKRNWMTTLKAVKSYMEEKKG